MSRVEGEQLAQGLGTRFALLQPQLAESPDQQAVLTVFMLRVVIQHDEIRQRDGEKSASTDSSIACSAQPTIPSNRRSASVTRPRRASARP